MIEARDLISYYTLAFGRQWHAAAATAIHAGPWCVCDMVESRVTASSARHTRGPTDHQLHKTRIQAMQRCSLRKITGPARSGREVELE